MGDAPAAISENECAPPHIAEAAALHQAGDFERAKSLYLQIIGYDPGHADAWHLLGVLAYQTGDPAAAEQRISKAISLCSGEALYYTHLGLARIALGKAEAALEALRKSLDLNPIQPETHNNLGLAMKGLGRWEEAAGGFREAIRLHPGFAEAHTNLGALLAESGRYDEAMAHHQRAIELKPDMAQARNNLGVALKALRRYEEAEESFREAVRLQPHYADAQLNLGSLLRDVGKTQEAAAAYRKALDVAPSPGTRIRLAMLLPIIYASAEEMRGCREALEEQIDTLLEKGIHVSNPMKELGTTNFYLAYQGGNDRELQQKIALLLADSLDDGADLPPATRSGNGRLRVGFLSAFFRHHTIGKLTQGLISGLSRERFEVFVYSIGSPCDRTSEAIRCGADAYAVLDADLSKARETVRRDGLDVLFFPEIGMDPFTYFLAFSRLAPVQCVSWGHPVTTGIPTIDCFLSARDLEPEGAEAHYSERLVRTEHLPAYYYRPNLFGISQERSHLGLPEDAHLYCCPQSLFKFHPDFDPVLGEILRRDPKGRVVLIEGERRQWSELLMERFRGTLPDVSSRVQFLPRLSESDFLGLLAVSDVILDPLHFGGGNSLYEAMALGTPIVTLPGEFMRGRVAHALCRQMDVMDGVASDVDDYVSIALSLGTDGQRRESVRQKILSQNHRLYENADAVRELDAFFVEAVGRASAGGTIK